jgi:hypothetical protein
MTSSKVWLTISRASCNGGEGWPELDVVPGVLWAWRRSARRRESGKRRSYQEVQEDEASLVAQQGRRGCSGSCRIGHRSFVWWQQDLVVDGLVVLVHKEDRERVREMREIEGSVPDQVEEKGMAEVYHNLRRSSSAPTDR